ncbi:hypothetical protein TNCV_481061 [Trichonephila clavipes]|nr:hypothetical protein TNCV_481061 [Trichonephila clavipes]
MSSTATYRHSCGKMLQQWLLQGTYQQNEDMGSPRCPNSTQYQMIIDEPELDTPTVSLSTIQSTTSAPVVPSTISWRLYVVLLRSQRPLRRLP